MLITLSLRAKWDGVKYRILRQKVAEYHGRVAYAFGGGGGGGEVVPTGPFGPQIPFIMRLFNEAEGLLNQGPPEFPWFSTVARPNPDIARSQLTLRNFVNSQMVPNAAAIDTAATSAENAGNNPVSGTANPLAKDLQQGLLELLSSGNNALTQQAGQTLLGATSAINAATGGASGPPTGVQPGQGPEVQFTGPGLNFAPTGLPNVGPSGLDINQTLLQNLSGSGLNPFIQDTVDAATRGVVNNFQRNVIPSIGDAASAAGQVGGTRQGIAEGIAAGDLQNTVGDITARLFSEGFNRNVDVQQNALNNIQDAQQFQAGLGLEAAGLGQQGQIAGTGLQEQIRRNILDQALQGAGLAQQGAATGQSLGQEGVGTGTAQTGNLLQAGNAQRIQELFGALGLLPALQSNQLGQIGALNQSGLQQVGFDQSQIDDEVNRFFFEQFAPFNLLSQFQNFIGGSFGSSVGGNPQNMNFPGLRGPVQPSVPPILPFFPGNSFF